jgi:hypothetical protein
MRAILAALTLGFVSVGGASAGDLSDPVWTKAPDRSDWAKAYPSQAAQSGVSGSAQVRCAATAAGQLQQCAVVAETPVGQGFGAAALSLMGGMELRATSESGHLIAGKSVLVPVKFTPDLFKPTVITNPDWMKKPDGYDLAAYIPANAGGREGRVVVTCVVTGRGLVDKCRVGSETPPGMGFGAAGLAMTPLFLMKPMTVDGEPVGGAQVSIPVHFLSGAPRSAAETVRVVRLAPWIATPTAGDVAAAFPKAALGRAATGHVVLRCAFKHDGALQACDTLSEEPKGRGFDQAARGLVKDFKVVNDAKDQRAFNNLRVDVPFDFRDPSQPSPRLEVIDPFWVQRPSAEGAAELFPVAAAKAGYKQGKATVECDVTHQGELSACAVVQEDPAGLGFSDSALKVASIMKMVAWTEQGTPVDGARIRLPVVLKMPDEPAAPPAAAKP